MYKDYRHKTIKIPRELLEKVEELVAVQNLKAKGGKKVTVNSRIINAIARDARWGVSGRDGKKAAVSIQPSAASDN